MLAHTFAIALTEPMRLPAVWVPVVVALAPLVASFTVKADAPNEVRTVVAGFVAVAAAVLDALLADSTFTAGGLLAAAVYAIVAHLGQRPLYDRVWKPRLPDINDRAAPTFGLARVPMAG